MNFYLSVPDDQEREPGDGPSIGLILCREHNRLVVEYALRAMEAPIGVSSDHLSLPEALPAELASALPSVEELAPGMLDPDGNEDLDRDV